MAVCVRILRGHYVAPSVRPVTRQCMTVPDLYRIKLLLLTIGIWLPGPTVWHLGALMILNVLLVLTVLQVRLSLLVVYSGPCIPDEPP